MTTFILTGALQGIHALSHLLPPLLYSAENSSFPYPDLLEQHIEPFLSSPGIQAFSLAFVPLSFWYVYHDHRRHKEEQSLHARIQDLTDQLERKNLELRLKDEGLSALHLQ
jgi:hypothetical protein